MDEDIKQKVASAQAAVETAAALLLEHAEGLAVLVRLERGRYGPAWEPPASMRHAAEALTGLFPLLPEATTGVTFRAAGAFAIARDGDPHYPPVAASDAAPEAAKWRGDLRRLMQEEPGA